MAIDSGDAAMMGLVIGGAAGHVLSDGEPIITILGAGAGFVIGGPGSASAGLGEAEAEVAGEAAKGLIDRTIDGD